MGTHIDSEGRFQSDKYPDLPPDRIVLSFEDEAARQALSVFCQHTKDKELATDILHRIETLLRSEGEQGRLL